MPKHESAWKQMFQYYRDEYHEQHAPMNYGDVWLKTKSHQRLILGLADTAKAQLSTVTELTLPTVDQHLAPNDPLVTITDATGTHTFTTPFGGTVQKLNTDLAATPAMLTDQKQKTNWLVQLKAD